LHLPNSNTVWAFRAQSFPRDQQERLVDECGRVWTRRAARAPAVCCAARLGMRSMVQLGPGRPVVGLTLWGATRVLRASIRLSPAWSVNHTLLR
jgi:hypothetical protein